ncbi:hypothetical protein BJX76DRAFT_350466 [Aspergillus varians]
MSTQAIFYPADPSLDLSITPESLFLGNGFSPQFLSLPLLENGNQHEDMGMLSMQSPSNQTGSVQAMAPNVQNEDDDTNQPYFCNRALQPALHDSRKESVDAKINQAPSFLRSRQSVPSFSSFSFSSCDAAGHDVEFDFDNSPVSPASDMSSNKSSFSLRWQNSDTDKRAKHLERNRAAASKSRQKKKRETNELQKQFQKVSHRRSSLDSEVKTLRSRLLSLKDQILMHSRCNDEAIHLYLSRMINQATTQDSKSSSIGEPDGGDARNHRQDSGYPSSQIPSELELSHSRYIPMNMDDTGDLPCGVDEPMMDHEIIS